MRVAIGGRVDDDLDALAPDQIVLDRIGAAILRADINSGFGRRLASGDVFKFGAVIAGEEDIVMLQVKVRCLGVREPDAGG